jgi:hypothetical protein
MGGYGIMKNQNNMKDLQTGDIILFRTKLQLFNPISWITPFIRFFTKCEYNHAGVILRVGDKLYLIEATEKGVVREDAIQRITSPRNTAIALIPNYSHNKDIIREKLIYLHEAGKHYDFISLFFYQLVKQKTGVWIGRKNDKASERFYCSELAAYVHSKVFPKWWEIAPVDLFNSKDFNHIEL